jgi:predicted lipid-binding transport protein (Tim44 family)
VKRTGVWVSPALASAPALALTGCVVATSGDTDGNGGAFIMLLLPLILVFAFMTLRRIGRRGPRSRAAQNSRPSTAMLRAELSVLADDIMRFEPRVTMNPAAGDDFDSATHRYRVAQAAMDEAPDDIDLVRVQRVVDEATWSMARARAIVEGRTPPQPPARLQRPGHHGEPAIGLDDGHHPTYVGSNAPYQSGWFAVGGGLFGGLLLGTMLGEYGGWVTDDGTSGADPDDGLGSGDMEW